MTDTPSVDDLCAVYISLRDQKAALEAAHKAQLETIESDIAFLQTAMIDLLPVGATSVRTPHGTISRRIKTRYTAMDMGAFLAFVETNKRLDLLERRVAQKPIETFVESTGQLPPGVHASSEVTLVVTRK